MLQWSSLPYIPFSLLTLDGCSDLSTPMSWILLDPRTLWDMIGQKRSQVESRAMKQSDVCVCTLFVSRCFCTAGLFVTSLKGIGRMTYHTIYYISVLPIELRKVVQESGKRTASTPLNSRKYTSYGRSVSTVSMSNYGQLRARTCKDRQEHERAGIEGSG
jgi:hypothetical protein